MSSKTPYIIGIAGGTGAGKTTLAQTLFEQLGIHQTCLIPHDAYYKDLSHLTPQEREQTNFDHPNSLDTELLVTHLQNLANGQSILMPTYNFALHTRAPKTIQLNPLPIIIVEGILIFTNPQLCNLLNLKLFVDTDPDIRLARRIKRDVTERGRTQEFVIHQYLTLSRPMHHTFVEPSRNQADLIIPGENTTTLPTQFLLSHLQTVLAST